MSKPETVDVWASNANYPAGSDPWSGEPTKVAPDAGESAAGFVPNTKPPAEIVNSLFNWITRVGNYLLAQIFDDDVEAPGFMLHQYDQWQASTSYDVGDRVTGDSFGGTRAGQALYNQVYECTVAGISAAPGPFAGPTGTDASITDGTVTWKYAGYTGYRHGTEVLNISPVDGFPLGAAANDTSLGLDATRKYWRVDDAGSGLLIAMGDGSWVVGIALPPGRRMTKLTFEVKPTAAVGLRSKLWFSTLGSTSATDIELDVNFGGAAAFADHVIDLEAGSNTPFTFADGDRASFIFRSNDIAGGLDVGNIRVSYDYLPPT